MRDVQRSIHEDFDDYAPLANRLGTSYREQNAVFCSHPIRPVNHLASIFGTRG